MVWISPNIITPFLRYLLRLPLHSKGESKFTTSQIFCINQFWSAELKQLMPFYTCSTSSSRDDDKASSQHGVSDSERSSHEWSGAPSPSCTSQSSGGVIMNGGPCTSYTSQSSVGGTSHGDECNSNSTSDSREEAKRQRFEAHRRQHYDMREALRR